MLKAGMLEVLLEMQPASPAAILDKWRKQRSRKVEPGTWKNSPKIRVRVDADAEAFRVGGGTLRSRVVDSSPPLPWSARQCGK